jgi:1-acyl-sn-glycerol-3-phosphate acyltransferase
MYRIATRDEPSSTHRAKRPRELLHAIYEYVGYYGGLLVLGVLCLLFTLLSVPLYWLVARRVGAPLGRAAMSRSMRWYWRLMQWARVVELDITELDSLREERSLVIAPNHPALLDAMLVISRLERVVCIMKAEIWDNVFLGAGSRLAGFIRNDAPVNMIKAAVEELNAGAQLLVFPEGTRTRKPPINAFKGGFALIAKKARAPIQTVFIETDSPFLSKGWPLLKRPALPIVFRARLGRRFEVTGDLKDFIEQLEDYYRQELGSGA